MRKISSSACQNITSLDCPERHRLEVFRERFFIPGIPVVLPSGSYSELPAFPKWFCRSQRSSQTSELDQDYLLRFGDPMLPVELTRTLGGEQAEPEESFQRFHAPLSFVLAWIRNAGSRTERIYLAQASVSDLPLELRDDLPVPDLVAKAGKGDVYDTNLWIGLAPTYTPLHRDPNPNLFVQLAGEKVVRLCEPTRGSAIFRETQQRLGKGSSEAIRGEEMMEGAERRAMEEVVWGKEGAGVQNMYEVRLSQGDGLFIPQGWWHSIKGVGEGVIASVSIHLPL